MADDATGTAAGNQAGDQGANDGTKPADGAGNGKDGGQGGGDSGLQMSQEDLNRVIDTRIGRLKGQQERRDAQLLADCGVESFDELKELAKRAKGGGKPGDGGSGPSGDEDAQKRLDAAVKAQRESSEKELAKERAEREKAQSMLQKHVIDGSLLSAAAKHDAVNPDQVAALLRGHVRLGESGQVEVLATEGADTPRYVDGGQLMTPEAFVREWLDTNPHFKRANMRAGSGGGSGADDKGGKRTTYKRSELAKLSEEDRKYVMDGIDAGDVNVLEGQ